jgi:hypothetical protein
VRDEGGPFGVGFQEQAPNRPKLLSVKSRVVVSVGDKSDEVKLMQVRVRETTERKPSLTRRNPETCRRNQGRFYLLGQACRAPEYWAGGDRRIGGVNLTWALMQNCGNQSSDGKGEAQVV